MNLSKIDYINILNHYKVPYRSTNIKHIKKKVEKLIAEKLCRCIKKVETNKTNKRDKRDKTKIKRAIGICNFSIIKRKNLKINSFTCNKKTNKNKITKKRITYKNKINKKVKSNVNKFNEIKNLTKTEEIYLNPKYRVNNKH